MSQSDPTNPSDESKSIRQSLQVEQVRQIFESAAQDESFMVEVGHLHLWVAEIIKIWQWSADGGDPTDFPLCFGTPGVSVTLRQVLALIPEEFQTQIEIEKGGFIASLGGLKSWLDESLMTVLVDLSVPEPAPGAHFARYLATDCNDKLDAMAKKATGFNSRLQYLLDIRKQGLSWWNSDGQYTVPTDTDRIVCFWNYTGDHFVVLSIDITDGQWVYQTYDSLEGSDTNYIISKLGLPLGRLIRAASDMDRPTEEAIVQSEPSVQQTNIVDCGLIAVQNLIHVLRKEPVDEEIDTFKCRCAFLRKILHALREGRGINTKPKRSTNQQVSVGGQGSNDSTSKLPTDESGSATHPSKLSSSQENSSALQVSAVTAKEYWLSTLRPILECGEFDIDQPQLDAYDKAMSEVLRSQLNKGEELAEKLITCIEVGLAAGFNDYELIRSVKLLDFSEFVDYEHED